MRFIDSHGEAWSNGELQALPFEWVFSWDQWNSWQKNILTSPTTSKDASLHQVLLKLGHPEPRAVAKLGWLQISKQHNGSTNFNDQLMRCDSGGRERVEEFDGVMGGVVWINDSVHRAIHLIFERNIR